MSLREVLRTVGKELKAKSKLREKMLANARRVTHLSKEATILIHRNNLAKAQNRVNTARSLLQKTMSLLDSASELQSSGALSGASQEYSEAAVFLNVEKTGSYPRPEEVGVSSSTYVLGLADVVGELRRKALDSIGRGNVEKAEWYLHHMEALYNELMALNESVFSVIPGLRRKSDVARHLVEITGSDVILEKRRKRLEDSLRLMEKQVEKSRGKR